MHFWKYVYVVFLSTSVIVHDVTILHNSDYQVILSTASATFAIGLAMQCIEDMKYNSKISDIFYKVNYNDILISISIEYYLYYFFLIYKSTHDCSLENTLFRCLSLLVLSNCITDIHYKKLVDQSLSILL